jgi:prepilin-type N-terminal cleavage/methylation domain-containing protein
MKTQCGFTVIEVIIAIVVLSIGLLGLVTTAALVTRMIGRGQRSAVAATFAAQQVEQLRAGGCLARNDGTAALNRGSTVVAQSSWTWTTVGANTYRLSLVTRYPTVQYKTRTDTTETTLSCLR